jgi:hypothetical protein
MKKSMQLPISDKNIFPSEVLELFQALYKVSFFEESMLIGSWVMPLYQAAFGIPEAYFIQKMITAQRRAAGNKKGKDLEQCSVIAGHVDPDRLAIVVRSLKLSAKTRKALLASCQAIDFPPQRLGVR